MSTITSTHYGVTISIMLESFPGCCGGRILRNLAVNGTPSAVDRLSMEQKHKMYAELFRKILKDSPGTIVAIDCVLNFGDWVELERSSSDWKQSGTAGDISTEDFCEWAGFERTAVAQNRNSGNLVACFSLATRPVTEDSPEECGTIEVEEPVFDDEPKAKLPADVADIIKQINALLA